MNAELTPSILAELRAQLTQRREQLRAHIAGERGTEGATDTPISDATTDAPGDRGDASVDLEAWDTGHQELLDSQAQLAEVEHALAKFETNTYGLCEECGRPIPLSRLRAIPEARYDVEHQAEHDRAAERR